MTIHTITLTTRDHAQVCFQSNSEQDLIAAADQQGIVLPSLCRKGGCGACLCTVEKGDYHLGDYNPAALSDEARQRGETLLCQTYADSDLFVRAPYDKERIRYAVVKGRAAEIVSISPVAERTVRLLLRIVPDVNTGQAAEFEAGQYMSLSIPGSGLSRPYSLANVSNWSGELEFFIRLHPEGEFSYYLDHSAKVGDHLEVQGPFGDFVLQAQSPRPRWFIGGGTGVAPLLSMLRRMAEFQESQPVHLYFGVNQASELFGLAEFEQLKQSLPLLKVTLCVWRAEGDWSGFHGTPVDALQHDFRQNSGMTIPDFYLCGPPALIQATTEALNHLGVPEQQIFSEKFLPSS